MSANGESKIISEATPVRIGLVIAFLTLFGTSVWWASSVNSKLDSIISNQVTASSSIAELRAQQASASKDINDLSLRVSIIESKSGEFKK